MNRILLKSILFGFILGCTLFAIAPLGLGISVIETLKPILVPGILVTQLMFGNSVGIIAIALSVILNGAVYSIPFFVIFAIQARSKRH